MNCNKCNSQRIIRNGITKSGNVRLRCRDCGSSQNLYPSEKIVIPCIFCGSEKTNNQGVTKWGEKRRFCRSCGKSWNPLRKPEIKPIVNCPKCDSENTVKNGKYRGKQKRICKNCKHVFNEEN